MNIKNVFLLSSLSVALLSLALVETTLSMEAESSPGQEKNDEAFINYFQYLGKDEAIDFINKSCASILRRLKINHVDDKTKNLVNDNFFLKIRKIVEEKAPGAEVYVSGGMVRSLLGYIYKKLYNAHMRYLSAYPDKKMEWADMKELVRQTFKIIIEGGDRKSGQKDKDLSTLTALGIGSDYDLLIQFPKLTNKETKRKIIDDVTDFINSAEKALGLRDDKSTLKKAILPIGDVKDYDKQLGREKDSAVTQGGSSLDWLAFPLPKEKEDKEGKIKEPDSRSGIMSNFLKGKLNYLKGNESTRDQDKQTIRGLRSLLEIPFLHFTEVGYEQISQELSELAKKGEFLSSGAQEQLVKMMRNARFEGAHNRFVNAFSVSDQELTRLIQQLNKSLGEKISPIHEFIKNETIAARKVDKGKLKEDGYLMNLNYFIEKYTDGGFIYHGTPDIHNVFYMIRNGLVRSTGKNGTRAVAGTGAYTAKEKSTSDGYTDNGKGVVLKLQIKNNENIRIIDENSDKFKDLVSTFNEKEKKDINKTLSDKYDIDLIVSGINHILIQNADAIQIDKKIENLIHFTFEEKTNKIIEKLNSNDFIPEDEIFQYIEYFSPKSGYMRLMLSMNPTFDRGNITNFLKTVLEKALDKNKKNDKEMISIFILFHEDIFDDKDFSDLKEQAVGNLEGYKDPRALISKLKDLTNDFSKTRVFLKSLKNHENPLEIIDIILGLKNNFNYYVDLEKYTQYFFNISLDVAKKSQFLIRSMPEIIKKSFDCLKDIFEKNLVNEETLKKIELLKDIKAFKDIKLDQVHDFLYILNKITIDDVEKAVFLITNGFLRSNDVSKLNKLFRVMKKIKNENIKGALYLQNLKIISSFNTYDSIELINYFEVIGKITEDHVNKLKELHDLKICESVNYFFLKKMPIIYDKIKGDTIDVLEKIKKELFDNNPIPDYILIRILENDDFLRRTALHIKNINSLVTIREENNDWHFFETIFKDTLIFYLDNLPSLEDYQKVIFYKKEWNIERSLDLYSFLCKERKIDNDGFLKKATEILNYFNDSDFIYKYGDDKLNFIESLYEHKDLLEKVSPELVKKTKSLMIYLKPNSAYGNSNWGPLLFSLARSGDYEKFANFIEKNFSPEQYGNFSIIEYLSYCKDWEKIKLSNVGGYIQDSDVSNLLFTESMSDIKKKFFLDLLDRFKDIKKTNYRIEYLLLSIIKDELTEEMLLDISISITNKDGVDVFWNMSSYERFSKILKDLPDRVAFLKLFWEIMKTRQKDSSNLIYALEKADPKERMKLLEQERD